MRLVVELQLLPDVRQSALLLETITAFNAATNHAAHIAWEAKVFSRFGVSALAYQKLRKRFGLKADLCVRAIGKAAATFARDRSRCPVFRPLSAAVYSPATMRFVAEAVVRILTLTGRESIGFVCGDYQRRLLPNLKGESDLVYRDGKFFLLAGVEIAEPPVESVADFIGVDMGVVNIAVTSDGTIYTSEQTEAVRRRWLQRQRSLGRMTKRTRKRRTRRNARRAMRYGIKKVSRFKRDVNHCISKAIIRAAKDTKRGVAVEELTGIRQRTRLQKAQRARHGAWAFAQLRTYLEYKGRLAGVLVVSVDPRNTSRTCSQCGYCDEKNRPSQAEFRCLACGFAAQADTNAAQNIRAKALADAPQVAERPQLTAA